MNIHIFIRNTVQYSALVVSYSSSVLPEFGMSLTLNNEDIY